MKTIAATAASAAGVALWSALSASSYVLPNSIGEQRFAADAAAEAAARPQTFAKRNEGESIKLQLQHTRQEPLDTFDKVKKFAASQKAYVETKYGTKLSVDEKRKRQIAGLVDYGTDSFYFAQVAIGTPAQNFNVILDTGSADFWVADTGCTSSQCSGSALYNPDASSTHISSQTPFEITYGSGAVRGTLYADTVSLAGYTVYNNTVADVTELASGTLRSPTSGIMGMGFQTLTTSGATPFWEVLALSNKLSTSAFTFQLARNLNADTTALNSGGTFTLGEIDQNQYQGDITWTNLPTTTAGQRGYWAIPLDSVELNGNTINTNGALAAIDTGTTLIGAPSSAVQQIYAQITDAQPVSLGGQSGYYAYPCTANPTVSMTFGGKEWSINSADFNGGAVGRSNDGTTFCLGAIFATDLGSNAPQWIVGDSFLKNVFSIYESSPQRRIGFAALKNGVAQNAPVDISLVPSGRNANANSAAATASTTAGAGIPSVSADSSAATNTGIVGGSGLPNPVAAATNAVSSALTTSSSSAAPTSTASSSASVVVATRSPSTFFTTATQASLTTGTSSLSGSSAGSSSGALSLGASLLSASIGAAFIGACLVL